MITGLRSVGRAGAAGLALGGALAGLVPAAADAALPVVASGLSNPRGMTFGPGGDLYVAESGRGGSGPCIASPEGGGSCYGATGAITRINVRSRAKRHVVTGLPSLAVQTGANAGGSATGPNDVSFSPHAGYFLLGLGANPSARATLGPQGQRFAGLYRIVRDAKTKRIADLGAFEAARNPDAGQPTAQVDTNPYSLDASVSRRILVTDAGGNDLLRVTLGRLSLLAVFPFGQALAPPSLGQPAGARIPYQPVPTGVVRGPDNVAYVAQLTGFPFPAGAANVFGVRGATRPTVKASGFTTIVDLARGRDGSLYVLQIASATLAGPPTPGKLIRIARDGRRSELARGQLTSPTGLAIAPNGDLYVANNGTSARGGQIVRIRAPR